MKYSPRQYAAALCGVLEKKSERERKEVVKNFLRALAREKMHAKLPMILREAEKQILARQGIKKVSVESASPLSAKIKKEIGAIFGKKIHLEEKTNPALLAGIKILVDDELLVDASGRRRVERLFSFTK
ncbi:MAG: ATP synthase subunit delta [Parcubacteria group bacterium Gr01-1014_33]|nr:MAG: ATP synthase subunit delta [Parcubacteria group bacterium Gr01-1014_33]